MTEEKEHFIRQARSPMFLEFRNYLHPGPAAAAPQPTRSSRPKVEGKCEPCSAQDNCAQTEFESLLESFPTHEIISADSNLRSFQVKTIVFGQVRQPEGTSRRIAGVDKLIARLAWGPGREQRPERAARRLRISASANDPAGSSQVGYLIRGKTSN